MARTPKKVVVVLTRRDHLWHAVSADKTFEATGHNTTAARKQISNLLQERFGQDVEIDLQVRLPEQAQASLKEHLHKEQLLAELSANRQRERVACAQYLLSLGMTQQEVGEMMGFTQNHLSTILGRRTDTGARALTRKAAK